MKQAIIFDMYETLISLWNFKSYMGREMSADIGIPESTFREIWDSTEDERTLGHVSFEEVVARILRVNNRYSDELYQELVRKRIASKEEAFEHMHPNIIPMLQGLRDRNVKIGLVTNCFNEEREAIRNSILFPYFDAVCMSCQLEMKKPDQRIFELCIERLGISAEDCLYCGDGGSRELEVARRMNMLPVQALWYLKENAGQPVGRLGEFIGVQNPMEILSYFLPERSL